MQSAATRTEQQIGGTGRQVGGTGQEVGGTGQQIRGIEEQVRFSGRILYLSSQAQAVRRQLEGSDLTLQECLPLRDDVSTDEITPVTVSLYYDERLGRYAHVGFKAGRETPIGPDAIRQGGFQVIVGGKRYGKGSSRESSPLAEKSAGVRLIVAESFERIYRQNCDNLGLLTTTDFALLERIRAGEAIPLDALLHDRDDITRRVLRAGGLLRFSKTSLPRAGTVAGSGREFPRPMTLADKIIHRHKVLPDGDAQPGEGLFLAADWRFSHDYFTGMCAHFMQEAFGTAVELERPDGIIAFQDHLILAPQSDAHVRNGLLPAVQELFAAHDAFARRYGVRTHGRLPGEAGSEGICHAIMAEKYALPGQVVVGTDSHTPHSGALGCLAFGGGASDVANSWVTGLIRCRMPETVRIEVNGRLPPGVLARDLVQFLLQTDQIRTGGVIGAVLEFGGEGVRALSMDERTTLTNMTAEMGGFAGIVEPDEKTVAFLRERRGIEFELEPWMRSDPDAPCRTTLRVDASSLRPMVARPGDPGNSTAVDDLAGAVRIDIALGGSCTGGKRQDFDFYHEVVAWGLERGRRVAPGTRFVLQFGTLAVREYCASRGYLDTFRRAGCELVSPGCGACANCGPGQSVRADEVTVSAINRNFPGRSGPGSVYLASPYTVAASALAGRIVSFTELQQRPLAA